MNQSFSSFLRRWLPVLSLVGGVATSANAAESVEIDGLYYELNSTAQTANVTYQTTTTSNYSSLPANLVIPATVSYNNVTFSVTEIADRAFANCTVLESISIPGSVTKVGTTYSTSSSDATSLPFYKCYSLKTVRFEDGDTPVSLGCAYYYTSSYTYNKGLFYYCPLEEVYVGRNITYEDSGYSFSSFPDLYGYSAFYYKTKLTKVTIGNSCTELPAHLFRGCSALTTIDFGSSLTAIPGYAFYNCNLSAIELPSTVTSIGQYAFQSNADMLSADLGTSVTTIGDYAFDGCTRLSDIPLGNSLTAIGDYSFQAVGSDATTWQPLTLPGGLKTIGSYAFSGSGTPALSIPASVETIGTYAFSSNSKLTSITFGNGCAVIPQGALSGCSGLTSIVIPEGVTEIADRAFANCTALESISIPGSVTKVGTTYSTSSNDASSLPFYKCSSLKSVRFEDGDTPLSLGCAYYRTSSYTYNKGLFYYCPLEEVYVGRNITYEDSGDSFSSFPDLYGYSAFYNQPKLTKVSIGNGCTELPDYLFYNNASITLMTLPNVVKIGNHTFDGCSKLTTLNLGNSLQSVGDYAFNNCANVTKLTFPNSITTIGERAFSNCSSVAEITIGSGLKSIGSYAFYNCKSFTALILPDAFTTMGESAFENCTKLTVAKLGTSLDAIPAKAFKECVSLSEMVAGQPHDF
ncbi:MAG: leucine-rich repeat domain-containing protein [Pseudoflavonifractor sp.]|nr:leucine-rich repeat domain-containing protein [Pseudoflavonifractor sp.]